MTAAAHELHAEPDRLMRLLGDHLHEHCACVAGEPAGTPYACDACELRMELRDVRDALLAWRAAGRRIEQRRDDALANAIEHAQRRASRCSSCAGLAGLAAAASVIGGEERS